MIVNLSSPIFGHPDFYPSITSMLLPFHLVDKSMTHLLPCSGWLTYLSINDGDDAIGAPAVAKHNVLPLKNVASRWKKNIYDQNRQP